MLLQSAVRAIYPNQCTSCDEPTDAEHGLCASCWSETQFISGTICDTCGVPLPGTDTTEIAQCDDCLKTARPWTRGRSVFVYAGVGRSLVLRLKHSDRTDLIPTASRWLAESVRPILPEAAVFVPVPLHWFRFLRRRYNQAALLSHGAARYLGQESCVDALLRKSATRPLDGHSKADRFAALDGAIIVNPKQANRLKDKFVVLVDDVMTSGATLGASADACLNAGAQEVCVATLARVTKDA